MAELVQAPMLNANILFYLFFAGAGAGSYLLASLVSLIVRFTRGERIHGYLPLASGGLIIGPALVLFGAVFLVADLGLPERAWLILLSPIPSILNIGAWLIVAFIALSAALFAIRHLRGLHLPRALLTTLDVLSSLAASGIVLYTGVFLAGMPALPFLHSLALVVLLAASALSCGAAVITLYGFFCFSHKAMSYGLTAAPFIDLPLLTAELLSLAALLATSAFGGTPTAQASAWMLLSGELAVPFWLGATVAGLVLPVILDLSDFFGHRPRRLAVGALLVLGGGLILRYCLLAAARPVDLLDVLQLPLLSYGSMISGF
ncbi:MAG: polysulfide reductase NrfD [Coriobacteriales bacterium]|jgi:formate-dependent nitrite reductase membrane component NrfD|nr:polysulfide reductase NrfD [Coriobacteriales bacterium]